MVRGFFGKEVFDIEGFATGVVNFLVGGKKKKRECASCASDIITILGSFYNGPNPQLLVEWNGSGKGGLGLPVICLGVSCLQIPVRNVTFRDPWDFEYICYSFGKCWGKIR